MCTIIKKLAAGEEQRLKSEPTVAVAFLGKISNSCLIEKIGRKQPMLEPIIWRAIGGQNNTNPA